MADDRRFLEESLAWTLETRKFRGGELPAEKTEEGHISQAARSSIMALTSGAWRVGNGQASQGPAPGAYPCQAEFRLYFVISGSWQRVLSRNITSSPQKKCIFLGHGRGVHMEPSHCQQTNVFLKNLFIQHESI